MLSAALLAMVVERHAMRAEGALALHVGARAARSEGQRDAVAQVMSLQMAYERSRSVLEALCEGVLVVDSGGEIVLANPAARRAMKMPTLDPGGRILWEVLTPELAQRARDAWEALRDGNHGRDELPQIRYSAIPCRDSVYDLTAVQATSSRTGQDFGCHGAVGGTRFVELVEQQQITEVKNFRVRFSKVEVRRIQKRIRPARVKKCAPPAGANRHHVRIASRSLL